MLVTTQPEVNVRAIRKPDGETFILMYSDENLSEARCCLGRMAMDPQLSLTWEDAARLAATMHKSRSAGEPGAADGQDSRGVGG
jgi:hypothetical protein